MSIFVNGLEKVMERSLMKFAGDLRLGWAPVSTCKGRAAAQQDPARGEGWANRNVVTLGNVQVERQSCEETL